MDNLEEMDRYLEKFNLPRLNQEEIEIMNKPITGTDIEAVIKKSLKKQKPRTRWLHRRILSNIRQELMPFLLKLFQKIAEEGTLPNSFYKATVTLIPKPEKDNTKKNHRPLSLISTDDKILNKILANRIQQRIKNLTDHDQVGFIPGMQGFLNIHQSVNVV